MHACTQEILQLAYVRKHLERLLGVGLPGGGALLTVEPQLPAALCPKCQLLAHCSYVCVHQTLAQCLCLSCSGWLRASHAHACHPAGATLLCTVGLLPCSIGSFVRLLWGPLPVTQHTRPAPRAPLVNAPPATACPAAHQCQNAGRQVSISGNSPPRHTPKCPRAGRQVSICGSSPPRHTPKCPRAGRQISISLADATLAMKRLGSTGPRRGLLAGSTGKGGTRKRPTSSAVSPK